MQNKKVLAVIPARYESRRFPGKLISLLKGKSVIYRVVSQILKCEDIDDIVLATDDERIAGEVASLPIDIVFTKKYFRNGTERVASIASNYPTHDVIINVQGDEPLLNPSGIQDLVALLKEDVTIEIASLMSKVLCEDVSEHVVKVLVDKNDIAIDFRREMPLTGFCYSHIGVYGFQREALLTIAKLPGTELEKERRLEQLRWLQNDYKIKMVRTDQQAISIDVPSDISKAELFISASHFESE
ncbi:MAG: 3-deoxy-manno-octulosonate cytidylyltransferase (CMP-KDO synthetase) [Saprospiraceae bacterium]|jgi:3-deoxy-manno-octulosonate cytidylyltransferase (CMP-KDO synthetase)